MTTTISIRTDDSIKKEAEGIFEALGLNLSTGINMYLHQVCISKGIPFDITTEVPNKKTKRSMKELDKKRKKPKNKVYTSIEELRKDLHV